MIRPFPRYMGRADAAHGTRQRFKYGCRCDECRVAEDMRNRTRSQTLRDLHEERSRPVRPTPGFACDCGAIALQSPCEWCGRPNVLADILRPKPSKLTRRRPRR